MDLMIVTLVEMFKNVYLGSTQRPFKKDITINNVVGKLRYRPYIKTERQQKKCKYKAGDRYLGFIY